jgi:hypothetical protein
MTADARMHRNLSLGTAVAVTAVIIGTAAWWYTAKPAAACHVWAVISGSAARWYTCKPIADSQLAGTVHALGVAVFGLSLAAAVTSIWALHRAARRSGFAT